MRVRGMIFEKSTYKQIADATTYKYHMRWQAISNNILRETPIKNKTDITNGIIKNDIKQHLQENCWCCFFMSDI